MASRLAGQCLVKSAQPEEVVHISLTDIDGDYGHHTARFMAQAELTEATALGLLHLLRHLGGVVLSVGLNARRVNTELLKLDWLGEKSDDEEGVLTHHQLPRLHCWSLEFHEELSAELIPCIPRFFLPSHFHTVRLRGIWQQPIAAQLEKIMAVSSRTRVVKELELASYLNSEGIDHVVRYFQQEAVDLKMCVPHIFFYVKDAPLTVWPSSCPPREAGLVVPYEWGVGWWKCDTAEGYERLEYSFTNQPSGRKFRVWLVYEPKKEAIVEFHLLL